MNPRFQTIHHAGIQTILTAVAQNKALVGRIGAVIEEGIIKFALAELTVRLDEHALLRHVQRVLTHDAETNALRNLQLSVFISVFQPCGEPVFLTVRRILKPRRGCALVDIRSVGKCAVFFVP